jgi:hypothetical protein
MKTIKRVGYIALGLIASAMIALVIVVIKVNDPRKICEQDPDIFLNGTIHDCRAIRQ